MSYPATIYILGEGPALHQRVAFSATDRKQIARGGRDVTAIVCGLFALVVPSDHDAFRELLRRDAQEHKDACDAVLEALDPQVSEVSAPILSAPDDSPSEPEETPERRRARLEEMGNKELRELCQKAKLAVRGNHKTLVDRLMGAE